MKKQKVPFYDLLVTFLNQNSTPAPSDSDSGLVLSNGLRAVGMQCLQFLRPIRDLR